MIPYFKGQLANLSGTHVSLTLQIKEARRTHFGEAHLKDRMRKTEGERFAH